MIVWDAQTTALLSLSTSISNSVNGVVEESSNSNTNMTVNNLGFDCFLCVGQSNSEGWAVGIDQNYDFSNHDIYQYPGGGSYERKLILASEPLKHRGGGRANNIGFHLTFAKEYQALTRRRVILIPCASGGTGFLDNRWNPGNDLFEYAVTNTQQVLALDSNNKLMGVLWHQGEQDVTAVSNYASKLDAMITAFRSRFSLSSLPFLLGELVPEWFTTDTNRTAINNIIKNTPTRLSNVVSVSSQSLAGNTGDIIHFNADSQRKLGQRYFTAYKNTFISATPPTPVTNVIVTSSGTSALISWSSTNATSWIVSGNNGITTRTTSSTSTTISGLTSGTNYTISIKAVNNKGESSAVSRSFTTTTNSYPQPTTEYLFNGNFNNTGSTPTAPINNGVTIVTDTIRGQVAQFSLSSSSTTTAFLRTSTPITANFTKAVWVKTSELPVNFNPNLISSWVTSNDLEKHALFMPNSNKIGAGYADTNYLSAQDADVIAVNIWIHYATTRNGNVTKLFKNGVLIGTGNGNFTGSPDVLIGHLNTSGDTSFNWIGQMDKVQIWDSALTDQQILEIYNQG